MGALDWESGMWAPLALTVSQYTTLGKTLPFPEPQLPCLESEEGTERAPQPLPATALHTRAKVKVNCGNNAELRFTTRSYHNTMISCADQELTRSWPASITIIVVIVVSKALKAGASPTW